MGAASEDGMFSLKCMVPPGDLTYFFSNDKIYKIANNQHNVINKSKIIERVKKYDSRNEVECTADINLLNKLNIKSV